MWRRKSLSQNSQLNGRFESGPMLFGGVIIAYLLSKLSLLSVEGRTSPISSSALLSLFLLDDVIPIHPNILGVTWTLVAEISFYVLMIGCYAQTDTLADRIDMSVHRRVVGTANCAVLRVGATVSPPCFS